MDHSSHLADIYAESIIPIHLHGSRHHRLTFIGYYSINHRAYMRNAENVLFTSTTTVDIFFDQP